MNHQKLTMLVRWTARIGSLASLCVIAAFLGGAERSPRPPSSIELIGLACFPGGVGLGLLLGWWSERWGGVVTALSLAGFYLWHFAVKGRLDVGPYFLLLAAPGLLYLIVSWLQNSCPVLPESRRAE